MSAEDLLDDASDGLDMEAEDMNAGALFASPAGSRRSQRGAAKGKASPKKRTFKAKASPRKPAAKGGKRLCVVCRINTAVGNNAYCKDDKKEYEALRKDASEQNKTEVFERARNDPVLFRKVIEDYRHKCSVQKTSSGWARPNYDFARIDEIVAKSVVVRAGGRSQKKDYFDILEMFQSKRMTQGDADK